MVIEVIATATAFAVGMWVGLNMADNAHDDVGKYTGDQAEATYTSRSETTEWYSPTSDAAIEDYDNTPQL